jgi:hypothetical protein
MFLSFSSVTDGRRWSKKRSSFSWGDCGAYGLASIDCRVPWVGLSGGGSSSEETLSCKSQRVLIKNDTGFDRERSVLACHVLSWISVNCGVGTLVGS